MIVCWSNSSNDSRWVTQEAEEARRRGILVPVLVEATDMRSGAPLEPPFGFRDVQAVPLVDWYEKNERYAFSQVLQAVERIPGMPTAQQRVAQMREALNRERAARVEAERRADHIQTRVRQAPPSPPSPQPQPQQPQPHVHAARSPAVEGVAQVFGDATATAAPSVQPGEKRYPWARFWAKGIDVTIVNLLLTFIIAFFGGAFFPYSVETVAFVDVVTVLGLLATIGAYPFIDALVLSLTGGSPGRALFRFRVIDRTTGAKPTYERALKRSWGMWWWGYAVGVPIGSLIANLLSYNYLKTHGESRWDTNNGTTVVHKGPAAWSWIVLVSVIALFVLLNVIGAAYETGSY